MTSQGRRRHAFAFVPIVVGALVAAPGLATAQASRSLVAARLAQTFQQADFDGDGLSDLIVADFLADEVRVIVNRGNGELSAPQRLSSGRGPRAVVAADFNQDGWIDVAVSNFLSGEVAVFLGEGGARFSAPRRISVGAGVNAMVGTDFTGDGHVDLTVANFISGEVVLLRGQPDGAFEERELVGHAPATSLLAVESTPAGSPQLLAVDIKGERAIRFVPSAEGLSAAGEESVALLHLDDLMELRAGSGAKPGLRRVSGDGQAARIEDGAFEPFVIEVRSPDGNVSTGEQVSFVDLARGFDQQRTVSLPSDAQGQTGAAVGPSALSEHHIVAAARSTGELTLFGATSTMSSGDLMALVQLALAGSSLGADAHARLQRFTAVVERELSNRNEAGAVVALARSLAVLDDEAKTTSGPSQAALTDVLRRTVNQLLVVGSEDVTPSTELTCGVPVAGSIDAPAEVDTFTFNVAAGERVEIHVGATSGTLSPLWRLLDDTGTPVAGCGTFFTARDCGPLPASGNPYIIEVTDNTQTKTGTYHINLERLTAAASCPNATVTCGAPVAGNIEVVGDSDLYVFSVTTTERVEIHVGATSGALNPLWRLVDGNGTPVPGCHSFFTARDCGPLAPSGNPYGIQVLDNTRTKTGTYHVNVERLVATAGCPNATVTCGEPVAGNIEVVGDSDLYVFSVTTTERVEIHVGATSGALNPLWRLVDGNGTPVPGCHSFFTARDCGPLAPSGNPYGIQVLDNTRTKTGTYHVNVERLVATAGCPNATVTCGEPVAGNIEVVGDSDLYVFSVTTTERVEIHVGATSGTLAPLWRLLDGTGTPVAGCGTFFSARDCGPLPPSGNPYAIQVLDNTRTKTGTYHVNLERLTGGGSCPNGTLTCGQAAAGTIAVLGDTDVFSFIPGGSGTVRVSVVNTSGALSPLWRLLDATGAPVTGCAAFGGTRTCSVTEAGSPYLVQIVDNTRSKTGSYSVLVDQCNIPTSGPDLVVTAISNPPPVAVLKSKITVTDTTNNQGGASAVATKNRYYFSFDQIKSANDKRLGGARNVPGLGAGASHAGSKAVTVPKSMRTGVYFLLACADDTKLVNEGANENNNCLASATTIDIKAPDLLVTAVSNPPAAASPGGNFVATDTVHNGGNADALQSSTNGYFLSLDTKNSGSDIALTGTRPVGALNIGGNSTGNATVTVPPSTPSNSYYLIACADAANKVAEGNASNTGEKNNCRASATKVTISP